ncbi:MAG: hypothetical protein LBF83_10190 [Spirochaetaceae bacterium]|jgi:hypothetical protein|nr:hypothetical protein [Spirochaetaceae bacterium]
MNRRHVRTLFFLILIFAGTAFPSAAQESDAVDAEDTVEALEPIEDNGDYGEDGDVGDEDGHIENEGGDIEDDDGDSNANLPITTDWEGVSLTGYTRGDQTFTISLGMLFPLFFVSKSGDLLENKISLGGAGSLAYNYFLNSNLFIGGILQGSFSQTLGKNFLYLIPIGFTAGYQFVLQRFEFPLSITVGGMTEQYLTYNGYWIFFKPQASTFFRFNSDWSFGLNVAWWLVPQWTNDPERDATGNFIELTLCARYHF